MNQFRVVHDDKELIVVDKAAGVLTVPTQRRERNTLVDLVSKHLRREVFVVHRLDRETSGLLVFAKDRRTLSALVEHWSEHERIYDAIVHGVVARDEGVVESRMITTKNLDRRSLPASRGRAPFSRRRGVARPGRGFAREAEGERDSREPRAGGGRGDSERDDVGERAVTRFRVVRRVRGATLVECELETGRRNQIRVHMKDIGHPILGDDRYARDVEPHRLWRGGLALHARTLAFTHPVTRERLRFDAGLPESFAKFLAAAT